MIPLEFVEGLAAGLVAAGGAYLFLWWRTRRLAVMEPPSGQILRPDPGSGAGAGPPLDIPPSAQKIDAAPPIDAAPAGAVEPMAVAPTPSSHDGSELPARLPPVETLRLSQRVILHVYAQGEVPLGEVAPPGLCQAGIGEALGVSQAGLAAVLRRLEAAGVLTTARGHVRGHDRRLKIYRLSSSGLEVAKELRTRSHRRRAR